MKITALLLALLLVAGHAHAALYQKAPPGGEPAFIQMSADAEAAARADPNSLFGNDSGFEVLLTADQAAEVRAIRAAGAQPTPQQIFDGLMRGGIQVTSSGPLDGTYAVDAGSQLRLTAIVAGIAAGQGLPGGGTTFQHPDTGGLPHAFTADQITALGKAIRDFVYAATMTRATLLAGQTASWPSNQISIP